MMRPPSVNNFTLTMLVSNTASAAIPTLVGTTEQSIAMVCDSPFDVLFSDDGTETVPNPPVPAAGKGIFGAGIIHTFDLGPRNSHFKAITSGPGILKHWRCSRT